MQLMKLKISNFRCFGPEVTTIHFNPLTTFIGANSSGKTAAMVSLLKLFGAIQSDREITRSDFHLPPGKKAEELENCKLFIEAVFNFPEIDNPAQPDVAIPSFFKYFIVEEEGKEPYLRIRLDATYSNDGSLEGLIDVKYSFIIAAESDEITASVMKPAHRNMLSNIRCIYIPALRNPSEQLKNVTGTLLNRLFQNIEWDPKRKNY